MLLVPGGRDGVGRILGGIVQHWLNPPDYTEMVGVRDREEILQGGGAVEMPARVCHPDVDVAEVGTDRRIDQRPGTVGVGIGPVAIEDHEP
ncbi:MAG: hypothetical protein E6I22_05570, partial [Chloroflexi bacterium]